MPLHSGYCIQLARRIIFWLIATWTFDTLPLFSSGWAIGYCAPNEVDVLLV